MSNPIQLLSKYDRSGSSGYLEIYNNSISWKVYLQEGKLKYIDCSLQSLTQLKYYLHRLGLKAAVEALKGFPQSELKSTIDSTQDSSNIINNIYERAILWLYGEKHLDDSQLLQLIENITKDGLESCLWMTKAESSWHQEKKIPVWLQTITKNSLSLELSDVIIFLKQRLKRWQSCASSIYSVYQRPCFWDDMDIEKSTFSGGLSNKVLKELAQIMQRGVSFRQLSIYLNRDELSIAQILSPYIENKMIYLRHPQPPFDHLPTIPRSLIVKGDKLVQEGQSVKADKVVREGQSVKADKVVRESESVKNYKIVCIDDSPTILSEIQRFLKDKPFEITTLDDPVKASTVIFRLKPDLILLDITMPRINGYKLCSLLRNSSVFDKTPIIMVTSNTGLIDKAKAKIAGATDYLTKPFTKEGLMTIITKHLVMKIISKYSD